MTVTEEEKKEETHTQASLTFSPFYPPNVCNSATQTFDLKYFQWEEKNKQKNNNNEEKKKKNQNISLALNECGIRKSGDGFLVGTRNFFSLSHARDKTDSEQIFSIPNYNSSFPTYVITVQYPPHNTALLHREIPSLSVYYSN